MAVTTRHIQAAERRVLLTPEQVALLPGIECSAATVRRHVRRYGIPRCNAAGFEEEGGRYLYLPDFEARFSGEYVTNHQRRNHLRRAGYLPS